MQDPLCEGLVQHLLVPFLQSFRLRDLLIRGVAVEDIVVSFTGGTCPDVALGIPRDTHRTPFRLGIDMSYKKWIPTQSS